ncbi:decarboxylating 6-phosphogluconate dehydrogenase [Polynucleobacter paneuropaeus]|nr:decarboxylating 6-phosphogluconate dehydrogenase [Polynucleobacter paneuropaeus]MBT8637566.1 decarboxylating 6-phosphogluconate dehydrogenase [Polynucleobacter paneuropaeus]
MKIVIIGLGKMGMNMAKRLSQAGISVIGFDIDIDTKIQSQLPLENFYLAKSISDAILQTPNPRLIWLMLPSGNATEVVINELSSILSSGDLIVDGANSNYRDTQRRGAALINKGYKFVDVGVSGGIWGLEQGYCLMVGGDFESVQILTPVFNVLAVQSGKGWGHLGPLGAGHFAKMIHNGIEYGMMQSFAEGLELAQSKQELSIDLGKLTTLWQHGSVVRSWLLDMLCQGMKSNPKLDEVLPFVPDSGEGRWFVIEAIQQGVATPVITQALNARFQSQNNFNLGFRLLSIMRNTFGGHKIYKR